MGRQNRGKIEAKSRSKGFYSNHVSTLASTKLLQKILAETIIDGAKIVLVNIYAPNDATRQVGFLRDLSKKVVD